MAKQKKKKKKQLLLSVDKKKFSTVLSVVVIPMLMSIVFAKDLYFIALKITSEKDILYAEPKISFWLIATGILFVIGFIIILSWYSGAISLKFPFKEYCSLKNKKAKYRSTFANCFHNITLEFKGKIKKITKNTICFERIYICGMYLDGNTFDGKEEHVWMSKEGFEDYQIGDSVSFCAEVYRYIKTGNGKILDYGLRNPENIRKIEPYELPTDKELIEQEVELIICETCMFNEQCNRLYCLMNSKEKQRLKKQMVDIITLKNDKNEKQREAK